MLAWAMRSRFAINLIEKWSYDYIKMDCEDGKCYGVLAVCSYISQSSQSYLKPCFIGSPYLFCSFLIPCATRSFPYRSERYSGQKVCYTEWVRHIYFYLLNIGQSHDTFYLGGGAPKSYSGWY